MGKIDFFLSVKILAILHVERNTIIMLIFFCEQYLNFKALSFSLDVVVTESGSHIV